MGGGVRALRRWLPAGGLLPEDVWERRHRGIVILLTLHAVAIPIYGVSMGFSLGHSLLEGAIVPATIVLSLFSGLDRRARTVTAAFGLLTSSAILVHLSGGLIEMHFHFFVMVSVVALYADWLPFFVAVGYVLVHHGIAGALDPQAVFNHPAAIAHPWRWAAIHSLFIAGISLACVVAWRLQETALAERHRAERRLRRESEIVAKLNEVSRVFNSEPHLETVMQKVTDIATDLTGAGFGAFFHNVDDGARGRYVLYTLAGAPREAFASFPMPRNTDIFAATFRGDGPVRVDDVTKDPRYGRNPPYNGMPEGHLPVRSYLAVPVLSRSGDVLGGLFFGHPESGVFMDDHERLATGIAAHAAVALENARLHGSERRSLERLSLIAEAGRRLSSSLELGELLQDLAGVIAPAIADLCVVYLREPDGEIRGVAMHAGPDFIEFTDMSRLPRKVPPAGPVAEAVAGGKTQFLEEVTDQILQEGVSDPDFRELLRQARPTSAIMLPLLGRHEVFGALSLATFAATGRRFGPDDVELAEELARRAAIAVENARLFELQRSAAATLQHSLLPESLPELPGIEAAARYIPGGEGVEIGGDWYDMFELPDGGIGLVMGDVVGRGVEAAALMGQLRNGLRALAMEGRPPADVLTSLNRMLFDLGPKDGLATAIYAVYDQDTGTLRVASAGHPPPLIVAIDGDATFFEEATGVPLGAHDRYAFSEAMTTLPPGSCVLLYTDGLIEDRDLSLDEGLRRLGMAASGEENDLRGICGALLERCLEGRDVRDDIAILAMRPVTLEDSLRLRLPARPKVLRPLRTTLRRWLDAAGVAETDIHDVLLAAGEACANAIRHPRDGGPDFLFAAELEQDSIRVVVTDHGSWRQARPSSGGRGLDIMRGSMDAVEFERSGTGTTVTMRKTLIGRAAGTLGRREGSNTEDGATDEAKGGSG